MKYAGLPKISVLRVYGEDDRRTVDHENQRALTVNERKRFLYGFTEFVARVREISE
ncbi:hypothetical protein W02_10850 [Nitrospira sp. KM1]|uniref:hypothetical protein n=1 Tax=Nitrospira sp. KM1 TaxID=1936990 RepID=UPI0013A710E7|nr:hypothetical protein [Nitrospira sp. KM1]BCA53945.1 hypothetical protein W02_10850 [Nitrospira sp. KM1]